MLHTQLIDELTALAAGTDKACRAAGQLYFVGLFRTAGNHASESSLEKRPNRSF